MASSAFNTRWSSKTSVPKTAGSRILNRMTVLLCQSKAAILMSGESSNPFVEDVGAQDSLRRMTSILLEMWAKNSLIL